MSVHDTSGDDGRECRFIGDCAKAILGMEGPTLPSTVMIEPAFRE
jgi:hypothetical protein